MKVSEDMMINIWSLDNTENLLQHLSSSEKGNKNFVGVKENLLEHFTENYV